MNVRLVTTHCMRGNRTMRALILSAAFMVSGLGSVGHADDPDPETLAPLIDAAGEYIRFQQAALALESVEFRNLGDIDAAVDTVAAMDSDAVARAWTSYAALIALQSEDFVDAVEDAARDYGDNAVANGLRYDWAYAGQMPGADAVRTEIHNRLVADKLAIDGARFSLKAQSYDLQSQGWASATRNDTAARLTAISTMAPVPAQVEPDLVMAMVTRDVMAASDAVQLARYSTAPVEEARALLAGASRDTRRSVSGPVNTRLAGAAQVTSRATNRPMTIGQRLVQQRDEAAGPPNTDRSPQIDAAIDSALTVAALAVLNEDMDAALAAIAPPSMSQCINTTTLNLQQCVAASKFGYEHVYCAAEYRINRVGECFVEGRYSGG